MTIKDVQHEKSDALPPSHSDNASAPPIDLDEVDVPVATLAINPEYNDTTGDSVIVVNDARVVVREDRKTILLPDFSQKIIEHRHMDNGTVDVFTRHVHNDGTSTYFEQLGVAESELALGPDGPCSPDQYKAGATYPPIPAQPNGMGSGGHHVPGAPHHTNGLNEQHEHMKRKRINKLVIHIIIFVALIVLAALYAEFLFFPAIIVGIVVIAIAVQLVTGETECCSCCDDCCCDDGCCDGCDPPSI